MHSSSLVSDTDEPVIFVLNSFDGMLSRYGTSKYHVPRYHGTYGTVFTRPILSGYLTRISETRIVKLR